VVSMGRLGTDVGPGDSVVLPVVDWQKLKIIDESERESC
jgi:hypothetical protein